MLIKPIVNLYHKYTNNRIDMSETNRIEYKRELTSELDIEKEVVALFYETTFARYVYM